MNITDNGEKKCFSCDKVFEAMTEERIGKLLQNPFRWIAACDLSTRKLNKIYRNFEFKTYESESSFVNKVMKLAVSEGHHPELDVGYLRVRVTLWTFEAGGVTINDVIFADKADEIYGDS